MSYINQTNLILDDRYTDEDVSAEEFTDDENFTESGKNLNSVEPENLDETNEMTSVECPVCLNQYPQEEVLECSNGHVSSCGYCLSNIVADTCTICRVSTMKVETIRNDNDVLVRLDEYLRQITDIANWGEYDGIFATKGEEGGYREGYFKLRIWKAKMSRTGNKIVFTSNQEVVVHHRENYLETRTSGTWTITKLTRTIKKSRQDAEAYWNSRGRTRLNRHWYINLGIVGNRTKVVAGGIRGIFMD